MTQSHDLSSIIEALVRPGKGILAADESGPTIAKRFTAIGVESTPENRRAYRSLLLSTPGLGEFVSGVILYEETLGQCKEDGEPLPALAARQGIVPGIKVDTGKGPLALAPGDEITQGLDGLPARLQAYVKLGARFAKWRAVYNVSDSLPSRAAIEANAESLARYAAICQTEGVVPIVEPEVLIDGDHSQARCAAVTQEVLLEVFRALHRHRVALEHMLLKPSMVVPGKAHVRPAGPGDVADETLRVLRRTVPAAVPGIVFLSGGQSPVEATVNLDALNRLALQPWRLSFSYGRALQDPVLQAWRGQPDQVQAAQAALLKRARLNALASLGCYDTAMENSP
ncbi:class I fructose-bisphosphate aldolase [Variovorax saccharolyticus]|uniref:class I fructose-bisphosphate aldolase n=1 Tax=Variovorax saccharolyticus TaxID=3053516 RepID=UPI0025779E22|nr:class I fructose-bisphosphate aldolase [Variovorax sp. J31P216]MDM0028271.1 fructose-bisphosphate aldolase class I [Variovorax sp. J31P216]